jgi:hypothetical protein
MTGVGSLDIDTFSVTSAFAGTIFVVRFPSMLPFFAHYKPLIFPIALPLPIQMAIDCQF